MEDAPFEPNAVQAGVQQAGVAPQGSPLATVRTYRQGLGDCHLVTLHGSGGAPYRILIDCGVALSTPAPRDSMRRVMEDVVDASGGKVDLLVASHEHWDHISGFVQAAESFDSLGVGEVWMGWTENPQDAQARTLREQCGAALDGLRRAGARMALSAGEAEANPINSVLGLSGAAGRPYTKAALEAVRAKSPTVTYCEPGDAPRELPSVGARIYVLGPPRSEASLRKILPPRHDPGAYELALDGFRRNVVPGLGGDDSGRPFSTLYSVPEATARAMPFFQEHYWDGAAQRRIDAAWMAEAAEFALALDSYTNNTSLVLAIDVDQLGVLLFPGDAQIGSWLSWGALRWSVNGCTVTGNDLLARTVFYKVGHHGSFNATPGEAGLDLMRKLRVAVIPVDHELALRMGWGELPLPELERKLDEATRERGYVLRTDREPSPLALQRGARVQPGHVEVPLPK